MTATGPATRSDRRARGPVPTLSTQQAVSAPFSLKIDASNSSGAIRASSGLRAFDQPSPARSACTSRVSRRRASLGLMDASGGVVALIFLLPAEKCS